jgi:hypothetical protein
MEANGVARSPVQGQPGNFSPAGLRSSIWVFFLLRQSGFCAAGLKSYGSVTPVTAARANPPGTLCHDKAMGIANHH